jgi:hypothetical protein
MCCNIHFCVEQTERERAYLKQQTFNKLMNKEIYINDVPYVVEDADFLTLECLQREMQNLANDRLFDFDSYKITIKLFSSFLKKGMQKKRLKKGNDMIYDFYYTR